MCNKNTTVHGRAQPEIPQIHPVLGFELCFGHCLKPLAAVKALQLHIQLHSSRVGHDPQLKKLGAKVTLWPGNGTWKP